MIDCGGGTNLTTIDEADLPILREWRNNPLIRNWCRQTGLISWRQHREWFDRIQVDPTLRMFLIRDGEHQVGIRGVCGLTSIDLQNRRAEFSLYIGPQHQRQGYAKRALRALINHGFLDLNLNSIWGESFDGNPAISMFEGLGFKKEGTRREFYFKGGRYVDAHLFSILSRDWPRELPLRNEGGHHAQCICTPCLKALLPPEIFSGLGQKEY